MRYGLLIPIMLAAMTVTAAASGPVQRGQAFVETNCARCHAVGRAGESPFTSAPPFRELHKRYPIENLAEALAEGIVTGHPGMPQFQLEPGQINDVLAYLRSLSR